METNRLKAQKVLAQAGQVILGKERQIREVLLALLAGGHVLLEDMPGVGKTTMALFFSKAMELPYRRVQFTPDVMPSDLTGFSIYRREEEKFVYQPGLVFCSLLLADELNRASPKTQSALLEVMEEGKVTAEGVTREVPSPFLVIAAQNPSGSGTQPLPEAQVDRFMVSLSLGYPDLESELAMAKSAGGRERLAGLQPLLCREELLAVRREIEEIYIKDSLYRYIVELIAATRSHPRLERGASPRGTIALVKTARAAAWLDGRSYVAPKDVREQFPYVAAHRVVLSQASRLEKAGKEAVLEEIAQSVPPPPMGEREP